MNRANPPTPRPEQYGGIDPYLLSTSSDLLGYEGIRLRILVREAQVANEVVARKTMERKFEALGMVEEGV